MSMLLVLEYCNEYLKLEVFIKEFNTYQKNYLDTFIQILDYTAKYTPFIVRFTMQVT